MFRTTFDKLLEKATSNIMMEPDWATVMQICDLIRQNDVLPKQALAGVKKKLPSENRHTAMFAVGLLESMVKNCGSALHEELLSKQYCEFMASLVKSTTHEDVRQKMLELIQGWNHAFRKHPRCSHLKDAMNALKEEGFKFPALRESDAMYSIDTAPTWVDGEVCTRCRIQFSFLQRKHHCRACGYVFCQTCSEKTCALPKFGIEKEVRVCDACYDQLNKSSTPGTAGATSTGKDADMEEYLKSSLAQQSQVPQRKPDDQIREEEDLELALALSQSEAEAKEKEKLRATSQYFKTSVSNTSVRAADQSPGPIEEQPTMPELARYLNRSYWENKQQAEESIVNESSAPATAPSIHNSVEKKTSDNGFSDGQIDEFVAMLKSQLEVFINRMKSNSSRGRSITNDSSVQLMFMKIGEMHSKLLSYIQQHDDSRLHYEHLQDKLTQVKDARAALDALRDEHRDKLRRQAEEAERQRQLLMAHKLDIMRKKKQEYLQYQRQVALQRIQEQEREMHMRQEQQKQQYIMGNQYFMGSPVHGQQFPPPNAGPPSSFSYQYGPQGMMGAPMGGLPQGPPNQMPPNSMPQQMRPPAGFPLQQMPPPPPGIPPPGMPQQPMMVPQPPMGHVPNMHGPPDQHHGMNVAPPPGIPGMGNMPYASMPSQQSPQQLQQQQPGAPPASPQMAPPPATKQEDTQTAELITFD